MGPRYVVVENVSALLSRGLGDVLGTLASLGYDAVWDCIPASAVGALTSETESSLWPTPQASDGRSAESSYWCLRNPILNPGFSNITNGGSLVHPELSEWLMGFPTGWTVFAASETP